MPDNLTSNFSNKKQLKMDDMKVPVIFHASNSLLLKEKTLEQLKGVAKNRNLYHHIAVLSDIHDKKGSRISAGTITASENFLFPQLIDTAPNCGMRMLLTDFTAKDLVEERAGEIFKMLRQTIPTSKYFGESIPANVAFEVFRQGSRAITDHLPIRIKNELQNTFKGGDMFECDNKRDACTKRDIHNVIPSLFLKMARHRLGILGATSSHFIYLLKVRRVFDSAKAQKLGVFPGQYVFFMHTGSGIIGRYISSLYTPTKSTNSLNKIILNSGQMFFDSQMKRVFGHLREKLKLAADEAELFAYDDQSIEGRMFITAHQAAGNYGFANRTVISHNLDRTLEKLFSRKVGLELLYDMPHVMITKENHFGKNVWIHRNGATRALPDEPVFVAPLANTLAYLGVGTRDNESTFFSANHEMGKIDEINLASVSESGKSEGKYSFPVYHQKKKTTETKNELYQNYADKIIKEMEANKIMKMVASFEPIAMLTY
jgi:RNA-splicing ligase RtcB